MCFQQSRRISFITRFRNISMDRKICTYLYVYGVKPDFQDKETAFMKLKRTYP